MARLSYAAPASAAKAEVMVAHVPAPHPSV